MMGPMKNLFIFLSNFGFLSSPCAKHTNTVTDIQSPTVGLGDDFQRKNGLKRSNDSNSETKTDIVMGPTIKILATYRATNAPFTKYWITFKQKFRFWSKFNVLHMGEQSQFLL